MTNKDAAQHTCRRYMEHVQLTRYTVAVGPVTAVVQRAVLASRSPGQWEGDSRETACTWYYYEKTELVPGLVGQLEETESPTPSTEEIQSQEMVTRAQNMPASFPQGVISGPEGKMNPISPSLSLSPTHLLKSRSSVSRLHLRKHPCSVAAAAFCTLAHCRSPSPLASWYCVPKRERTKKRDRTAYRIGKQQGGE
jgi:hypothetical protein